MPNHNLEYILQFPDNNITAIFAQPQDFYSSSKMHHHHHNHPSHSQAPLLLPSHPQPPPPQPPKYRYKITNNDYNIHNPSSQYGGGVSFNPVLSRGGSSNTTTTTATPPISLPTATHANSTTPPVSGKMGTNNYLTPNSSSIAQLESGCGYLGTSTSRTATAATSNAPPRIGPLVYCQRTANTAITEDRSCCVGAANKAGLVLDNGGSCGACRNRQNHSGCDSRQKCNTGSPAIAHCAQLSMGNCKGNNKRNHNNTNNNYNHNININNNNSIIMKEDCARNGGTITSSTAANMPRTWVEENDDCNCANNDHNRSHYPSNLRNNSDNTTAPLVHNIPTRSSPSSSSLELILTPLIQSSKR